MGNQKEKNQWCDDCNTEYQVAATEKKVISHLPASQCMKGVVRVTTKSSGNDEKQDGGSTRNYQVDRWETRKKERRKMERKRKVKINVPITRQVQIIYKPDADAKELTQEQVENVTRHILAPSGQSTSQIIRQKILSQQSASQVVRLAQQGQQQSAVVQMQQGGTPRHILVQQGNSVILQQHPRKASQQTLTVGSQQVQIVPQARTQQWLGYQQQHLQTHKIQTQQQQQLQSQQQICLQQVQQQEHVAQNHQQVELQNQELKNVQRTLVSNHVGLNTTAIQSNSQYVDSSGQVIQLPQIYLAQQSPVNANITRNVNQFGQN